MPIIQLCEMYLSWVQKYKNNIFFMQYQIGKLAVLLGTKPLKWVSISLRQCQEVVQKGITARVTHT